MDKLYYCCECKRVITNNEVCDYCKCQDIKALQIKAPVNVIGTKIKGKVLKISDGRVNLIVIDEYNAKMIKEYNQDQLKKVL